MCRVEFGFRIRAGSAETFGMQSFFKTPGKAQPERAASEPAESPQTAQKPRQPYLDLFSPAPEHARYACLHESCYLGDSKPATALWYDV